MKLPYITPYELFRAVGMTRWLVHDKKETIEKAISTTAKKFDFSKEEVLKNFNLVEEYYKANPEQEKSNKALTFIKKMIEGGLKESDAILTAANYYSLPYVDLINTFNKKKTKYINESNEYQTRKEQSQDNGPFSF